MKRLFGLFSKGQGPPPSPSGGTSLPCVGAASELREKELGKLHRAAASGDLARVRRPWWLRRLGIDRQDKAKRTPLHLACANGHSEVVSYLVGNKCKLDPRDNFKRSPLMKAVQCQQEECVAILLAHGADPNLADVNGSTALHLAAIAPNTSLAGQLLEHNARIDARNKMGYTPLALAVSKHHEKMVEFLLKKGADVHARDQSERTPLMLAASAGDMSVIEVLLRYGADLSQEDILGWTVEDYARTSGHARVSQHLVDSAVGEKAGEASAGGAKGVPALSTPPGAGAAGFALGACALASGGVTSAAGVEWEEDSDSPWDSEVLSSLHSSTSCLSAEAAVKQQAMAGELQEEVADALEKQSLPEALLEVTKLCCSELKEGKLQLQEELDRVKAKVGKACNYVNDCDNVVFPSVVLQLQELEEQCVRSERCVQDLKTALENKQREALASSQQLQDLLGASSGAVSLKDLEE
ncbi:ankyrin repeat domain-containing protein 7-like [Apteryx mantelli]|uniref:Ankyrin repeat domain-containing protein 7-like n=1 Tax=Apteryx mantelli TaxID=2696672 RepID=A0ABM4F472_9AVES